MFRKLFGLTRRIFNWFRILGIVQILTIILIVVGLLVAVSFSGDENTAIEDSDLKVVITRSVAALSSDAEPLSVIGIVESKSEADIRAQAQGEITQTYVELGERVFAGQVLAQTENSSQRATLLQAQGVLEAAEANLAKLVAGSRGEERDILSLSVEQAEANLEQAKVSALNTLDNAFAVADDIIFNKVDPLFSNPRAERPALIFTIADQDLSTGIEDTRASVGRLMDVWKTQVRNTDANDDLETALSEATKNLNQIRTLVDDMARAVNTIKASIDVSETDLTTHRANMLTARSSLNSTISGLATEINSLNASFTSVEVAKKNKEIGITGGRSEDVVAAQASVKQAQGSLAGARAAFEKTVVRSPITGTLNSFPIKRGDFVSLFEPVAVVSNNDTLIIKSFITESDKNQISVGSNVLIDGRHQGVVTNMAPALDPVTKKIEVNISPKVSPEFLVNGGSVRLEIDRNIDTNDLDKSLPITVPISALKIEPDKVLVFSVDEGNALVSHPVTLGPIVGEKVVIADGLTVEMTIVTDARGLKDGQVVEVR